MIPQTLCLVSPRFGVLASDLAQSLPSKHFVHIIVIISSRFVNTTQNSLVQTLCPLQLSAELDHFARLLTRAQGIKDALSIRTMVSHYVTLYEELEAIIRTPRLPNDPLIAAGISMMVITSGGVD